LPICDLFERDRQSLSSFNRKLQIANCRDPARREITQMLKAPPIPFLPTGRKRVQFGPPVPALVLTAAMFDSGQLLLSFDREVDVSAVDPSQIFVNDGPSGDQLQATDASQTDPNGVKFSMSAVGRFTGTQTFLLASNATRIVALDDGGAWPGTEGTVLPVP
jgi:hypothetical protein